MQVYKKISTSIANKLIDKEVICKEKYSIFQYGCELMISTGVSTIIFVIISLITQSFLSSMLFYAGFLLTRKFCGGFHASTYIRCHLLFAFNHLVFIVFDKFFPHQYDLPTVIISGAFCIISIILFAPIDHKNKPFTKGEYYFFRKCSFILSGAILVGLTVSVVFMNVLPYFISVVFGVFSATVSMLVARFQRRSAPRYMDYTARKEKKKNEEPTN